jgi:hypothetical protein
MEKIINGVPHIPIEDVARELNTTHLRLLMLIKRDVMKGCQVDGEWYVEKGTIGCFRSYETDDAKPGGCKGTCASGGCGAEK